MSTIKAIAVGLASLLLTSCATYNTAQYIYEYKMIEPQSESHGTQLEYADSLFAFRFTPLYNGIYFEIKSLTDKPGVLLWDYTYFMTPDGNSYNALHTDLLETNERVLDKAKYQSIIPTHGYLSRFTTPVSNIKLYTYKSFNKYAYVLGSTSYNVMNQSLYEYYRAGAYYPIFEKNLFYNTDYPGEKKVLLSILNRTSQKIINQRDVGIGFRISINEKMIDYSFIFEISKILIHRKNDELFTDGSLQHWFVDKGTRK